MREQRDLRLVVAATALCAVGSLITPLGAVRIVFAAPLTLFLPGYAITAAVFGPRQPRWPEMVPLTVSISLATIALGGILLNYTPGGIRGLPWTLLLTLVIVACCQVAAVRRSRLPTKRRRLELPRVTPTGAILLVACVALTAAALALAQTTLRAENALGYTELWMVPREQTGVAARIGVTSQQQNPTAYRLEVKFGDRRQKIKRSFELEPGETLNLHFSHPPAAQPVSIKAQLFKRGKPHKVYRSVDGWLPAAKESSP